MSPGLSQSIQTRLVRHAKAIDVDPNFVLARFATERLLYRLSQSAHAERFVLKGALLLLVWLGETIRPTRDADLLGFGDLDVEPLSRTYTHWPRASPSTALCSRAPCAPPSRDAARTSQRRPRWR